MKNLILLLLGIVLLSSKQSEAQSNFENNVNEIIGDPSKGESYLISYSQPLVTAFGTIMASGLFNRAETQVFPHFDLGLTYIYLKIPEMSKTFYWGETQVPTVFGDQTYPTDIIPGTATSDMEIPQLQLNLGLTADIELMLRTWPKIRLPELGEIRYSGFGIKYGLSELVSSSQFPIDLSVQASYHLLSMSNWIDAATFAMNIQSSRRFSGLPLSVFAGLGYEVTSMTMRTGDLAGVSDAGPGDVKLRGQNGLRFVIGLNLHLWIITLFADYEIGYYNSVAGGFKIVL